MPTNPSYAMPEVPDLNLYIEHLTQRLAGQQLLDIRISSPFVLRTVTPTTAAFVDRKLLAVWRIAKQLVFEFEGDHFMVMHLMISGRLQWRDRGSKPVAVPKRIGLLALDFESGTVLFTEASKKKRASLRLLSQREALNELNPGGLEIFEISQAEFAERLRDSNHTLKRALTDQRVFAGIGNAYSDEILHRARLSPFKRARTLKDDDVESLYLATRGVLSEWIDRLREQAGESFPAKVTAFHAEMAVHGKYRKPCPVCAAPVQRIQYAENEANYCARCQTEGRLLADRSLSRLLKDNWPKRIEDLEW
ncbi:MAG: Fpg/Nei family DNA glycosylase [Pseudomonadales bacterium]